MKLFKRFRSKKGFTLIEMVVTLTVMIIILGFITNIFVQTMRIETGVTDIGQMEVVATEVMSELIEDLRMAKAVDMTTVPGEIAITTDSYVARYSIDATDEILMREYKDADVPGAKPVLDQRFYMDHDMELTWTEDGDPTLGDYVVTLEVALSEQDGTEVYREEYVVRPSYMNANI